MTCPTCGKESKGTASFCVFCGSRLLAAHENVVSEPPLLECQSGDLAGHKYPLTREGLIIGRDPSCGICLNNPEVSRRHSWVGLDENGRPTVIDQGSANGTFVNERRVTRAALLSGDQLAVGVTARVHFQVTYPQHQVVAPPQPVASVPPPPVRASAVHPASEMPSAAPLPSPASDSRPESAPAAMANRTIAEAVHFKVSKPRLQLVIDHFVVESYAVSPQGILIGRDPANCMILLDHPSISRVHARVVSKGGMVMLIDEGSANGTFVNNKRITEHLLIEGEIITFGVYSEKSLIFRDSHVNRLAAKSLKLDRDVITLGRDPGNDVVLEHPLVSKFHARMVRSGSSYIISDLGSLNGTFVNGRKVATQLLSPRDRIVVGGFELNFDGDQVRHESEISGLAIDALGIQKQVAGGLVILDNISLSILPNEFVGLLGPSGAGKSTLMDALNGFRPPTSGNVIVNGLDLYASYDQLRTMIGYVPQDDIIHRQLTVYRCLYYAAKMRLPSDTPVGEIENIISDVLKTLELEERRNTLITRLSGGQRKRINIGVELVTRPTLLFLDEPTSGLDPRTEAKMMALFRQLADQGRTVLLTTHVMASLTQLDKIIVLVKGKLAYYGTAVDLPDYFGVENAGDVFDKLETKGAEEWKAAYAASSHYTEHVKKPLAEKAKERQRLAAAPPVPSSRPSGKRFSLDQFKIQSLRYSEIKFNDRLFTAILLIQAPLLAGLDILVTTLNGARLLFLLIFGAIWYGFTNATREIVGEQAIYKRERQTGLKIPSYLFSKIFVLAVIGLVQCFLTMGTLTLFGQLSGNFVLTLLAMFLVTMNGILLGLLVSALVKSTELAITFGIVALFPQILFAGLLLPVEGIQTMVNRTVTAKEVAEMSGKTAPGGALDDVPMKTITVQGVDLKGMGSVAHAISMFIATRWGLEALADIYRKEEERKYPGNYENLLFVRYGYWTCTGWLIAFLVLEIAAVLFVLKRKDFKT